MITFKKMLVLLLGLSMLTACTKNATECGLIPAKVIRYDCERVIFQLLTSEPIGDMNWKDVQSGQFYDNVVSYDNTCEIAAITEGELDTLFVKLEKIASRRIPQDCVQCQAVSEAPPATWVKFTVIKEVSCTSNQ